MSSSFRDALDRTLPNSPQEPTVARGASRRALRRLSGQKSLAGLPPLDEQSHPTRRATGIRARGSTSRSSRTPRDDYRLRAWSTSYGSFTRRSDRAACCSTSILFPGIRGLRSGAADAELLWATSTTRWASTRSARRARLAAIVQEVLFQVGAHRWFDWRVHYSSVEAWLRRREERNSTSGIPTGLLPRVRREMRTPGSTLVIGERTRAAVLMKVHWPVARRRSEALG